VGTVVHSEVLSRLKAVAQRRRKTLSEVFDEALREYLARQGEPDSVILSTQGILRGDPGHISFFLGIDPYED